MSGSRKMFLLLITLMACYIPEILSKSFCGTGNDFNICIDYVKCSDPPKLTLSVKRNNGEVVFEKKIPPSMEISVPGSLDLLKLQVKVEKEDGIATLKVALITFIGSQDIISEKLYDDDCTEAISARDMFRRNKKNKEFSMQLGLANIAVTASRTVGIEGAEQLVQAAFRKYQTPQTDPCQSTMKFIAENIIGRDLIHQSPFGPRKVVYCDYTASGKSLKFIEDYIRDEVLPYYGNTHTTTTISSLHTGNLRSESKQIIRKSVNATDDDAIIFVSSGTTGAIGKLIHALDLKRSPFVFISPYEHHSNLLPWLEVGAEIIYGNEDRQGRVDLIELEENLKKYSKLGRPMIGSFSAASNITGILSPVDAIATLLHRYGAYAFFDYATAGPYVEIDMNPSQKDLSKNELSYKDAVFCSIHKFVGGPGTPGLLVAKKKVFINPVPDGVGGGTVLFVTHKTHEYIENIEEREEGGTPAIVESIRAGLVFQIKEEVTSRNIMLMEHKYVQKAFNRWKDIPNIHLLGKSDAERLPIFSLYITHPNSAKAIHHNFVSVLLNDLFGVQARGGCACAGPYAEDLLGIEADMALKIASILKGDFSNWEDLPNEEIEQAQGKKFSIYKPGFCRLNLPYFEDEETIDYILDAVAFVAEHGWKLLPMYDMFSEGGDYKHKDPIVKEARSKLADVKGITFKANTMIFQKKITSKKTVVCSYKDTFKAAKELVDNYEKKMRKEPLRKECPHLPPNLSLKLTWFLVAEEAHAMMKGGHTNFNLNYIPLFYPRGDPSIHIDLTRTRRKTLSSVDVLCNCEKQSRPHKKMLSCVPGFESYQTRGSFLDNKKPETYVSSNGGEVNNNEHAAVIPEIPEAYKASEDNTFRFNSARTPSFKTFSSEIVRTPTDGDTKEQQTNGLRNSRTQYTRYSKRSSSKWMTILEKPVAMTTH